MWDFSVVFWKAHCVCLDLAQMQTVCLSLHWCKARGFMDVESVLYNSLGRSFNPLLRVRKGTDRASMTDWRPNYE